MQSKIGTSARSYYTIEKYVVNNREPAGSLTLVKKERNAVSKPVKEVGLETRRKSTSLALERI